MLHLLMPKDYEISALLPNQVTSNYQTTLVTNKKEKIFLHTKIKTVIRHLAIRNSLDLCCLRAKSGHLTIASQLQPLPFSPELLLVPLKIHIPKFRGDSTVGYVNFHHVASLHANQSTTSLLLHNGTSINVLWREHTVKTHLQKAYLTALEQEKQFSKLAERVLLRLLRSSTKKH